MIMISKSISTMHILMIMHDASMCTHDHVHDYFYACTRIYMDYGIYLEFIIDIYILIFISIILIIIYIISIYCQFS
jgi:hypothetical protein